MTRRGRVAIIAAACAVVVLAAGNVQYFFVSTYRVKNASIEPATAWLTTRGPSIRRRTRVATVSGGNVRTGWLRSRGDSSFVLRAGKNECETYVETAGYHVEASVDVSGRIQCVSELAGLFEFGWRRLLR